MRMFQVDAFTDRLFAGNPAAVLVLEEWLSDEVMLAIAQENNLPETAYLRPRADGDWDLRWFAPALEVDFCGHATLASAHVLFRHHEVTGPIRFHTRVGVLRVSDTADGYRLDLPRLPPEPLDRLPDTIRGGFAEPPAAICRNFENIFVDLGTSASVRAFQPDLTAIARMGRTGLVVTGKGAADECADFVSRYFAPGAGIPEDPVTGSIHATLVPYWAEKLNRTRLTAFQASPRGGWIGCEDLEDRVYLTGRAITYMEGTLFLSSR